jgi:membrane protein insertase Oxa1/YidC/SpoIIIJ
LIPLYAVGVFLSFTLSQFGMFIKWIRTKEKGWKHKAAINGFGAIITAVTTVIVFSTKAAGGAWMLAIAIPVIALFMNAIKRHYTFVAKQLKINDFERHYHRSSSNSKSPCIVLISSISKSTLKSLNYANTISSNVTALFVSTDEEDSRKMRNRWTELKMDIPLVILYTISMFITQRLTITDATQAEQQKIMSRVMPLMLAFFFWKFASAFLLYWLMLNIVMTAHQYYVMKHIPAREAQTVEAAPAIPARLPRSQRRRR